MIDIEQKAREYADEVLKQALLMYDKDASEFLAENAYHAYLQGMKDALGNQWRDAEKEKPEDEEYVLIYHHKYGIEPAVWNERFNCWDDAEGDDCMYSAENVIAWLPIPEYKPKEE